MSVQSSVLSLRVPEASVLPGARRAPFTLWWGWGLYLVLAAVLTPVLKPVVIEQYALMDFLNISMMALFALGLIANRTRLEFPFLPWVAVVAVGSLIAITNAHSFSRSVNTLVQDLYLYLWFVVLVNMMKDRGDLRGFRIAWVWVGIACGVLGVGMLVQAGQTSLMHFVGPHGSRSVALFDGPNSLADYLMMSLFVALSLIGQVRGIFLWPAIFVLGLELLVTKSNGALSAAAAGIVVWALIRAFTRAKSPIPVFAVVLLLGGVAALGLRVQSEWDIGGSYVRELEQKSVLARLEKSSDGREVIWHRVFKAYEKMPLGIGPGNSAGQHLSVGERERKKNFISKEAHNDYIAYLVERGPLGIIGLVGFMVEGFVMVAAGWRRRLDRAWRAGAGGAMAAALAGGLVATAIHSVTMEKMHFRHLWMFMALVAAFGAASAFRAGRAAAVVPAPERAGSRRGLAAAIHGNGTRPEAR